MLSIETLLVIHIVSLLIERQPILKIKYKIQFFKLSLHNIDYWRVSTLGLAVALTLGGCDLEYFTPYNQFLILISKSLHFLIQ
jgi:hypothetical protein